MNWKLNEKNVINRAEMILCDGKISKLNQGAFAGFMTETDAHNVLSSSLVYKVTWHLYSLCFFLWTHYLWYVYVDVPVLAAQGCEFLQ